MSQAPNIDLNALWKYITDQVKARVQMPALWRSMEAATPLAIENDELVMGFDAATMHQSGLLLDARYHNMIEQMLETATRKRLRIRVVQGTTPADWEQFKQQLAEGERLQKESRDQFRTRAEAGETWEAVGEQLVRAFGNLPHRALPSVQGRFLEESLERLTEAYSRLMADPPSEPEERAYSRVLERLAERINVPSALISHMVYARAKAGKG
jgi:hypothetical protein